MTPPRTAVHASGARRRTPARAAGTRPRRPSGSTAARRRTAARPTRQKRPPRGAKGLQQLWPGLLVVAAVLTGLAWDATDSDASPVLAPGHCVLAHPALPLTAEQLANARTIARVAQERGLPPRAVVIALATAQQESRLRNLDYGDRDSLGLFQQRPSQGWGTEAQVQDPAYAAGKFYDGLVKVPGWDTGRLTDVAQSVQRSGFPEAYQQWEPMAQAWTAAVLSGGEDAIACGAPHA